jgi:hypothetical protein
MACHFMVTYPGPIKIDLMYHRESEIAPAPKWTGGVGYMRLETRLDPGMAQRLDDTLGLLEAGELYDALQAEISLFRDLCEPLFERLGSTYDRVPGRRSKTKWSSIGTRAERRGG